MVLMLMDTTKSTGRRQVEDPENRGGLGEEGSEGSPMASVRDKPVPDLIRETR